MPTSEHDQPTADTDTNRQEAIKLCHHAADALDTGDLAHAQTLLAEAQAALDRAPADSLDTQTRRETGWDCYD